MSEQIQERSNARRANDKPMEWAAYVAGHHFHLIDYWLEEVNEAISINMPPPYYASAKRMRRAFGQLNNALRLLALGGKINEGALVEIHRLADGTRRLCLKNGGIFGKVKKELMEWRIAHASRKVDRAFEFARKLLSPSNSLQLWKNLGDLMGKCRHASRQDTSFLADFLVDDAIPLKESAMELLDKGGNDSLERLVKFAEGLAPLNPENALTHFFGEATEFFRRRRELALLDEQIQGELRGRQVLAPVLILDPKRLVFFGEECPLGDIPHAQRSVLWFLAERPKVPVQRIDVIKKSGIQTNEWNLKSTISRLRTILSRMYKKYQNQTGNAKDNVKKDFIISKRGNLDIPGWYMLNLEPAQVSVTGPRP